MRLAIAQSGQVSGIVVDETGVPVTGASVLIKGTSTGTLTDSEGRFAMFVPEGVTTLTVRYVGYAETNAPVAAAMRIVLQTDEKEISEVVVTAMGILRADRSVGYAVAKVDPNSATQKAEPDLLRSLDGKIPGVQVSSSSAVAGSATKVIIRGNSSFLGNNDPLYVVDGIPYSNPEVTTGNRLMTAGAYGTGISTLDPNDIESMSVLKGAAAAALYGSRAANGVVLITTKSGSKRTRLSQKKFEVSVSASYAVEGIASLPDYQNSYGQGSNFQYSNANGSWGPPFTALDSIATYPSYLTAYPDMSKKQPYQAYPNNVKELFKTGGVADISVNLLSNNDKGNFSTTVSQLKQDGAIPYSDFTRTSFSVGGNQNLDNGVRVNGAISYSRSEQNGPFFGAGNYSGSVSSFARTMLMPRNYDIVGLPYETPTNANLFPLGGVDNPLWSWKYNTINTIMDRTTTNISAGYDITSWLSVDYQFGWNQYEMNRKQVINIGSVGPSGFAGQGQITNDRYATQELESNLQLAFKRDFGTDFNLRAVLGHNVNQRTITSSDAVGNTMIFKNIYNVDNTQEQVAGEGTSKRRLWAAYADVLLGYKNYAFLNATLRNDHSSTLPVENNSYFYPAVVGSFVFSDAFSIIPDVLNYGKVRASWGMVGNDASPYYVNGTFLQDTPFEGQAIMLLPTTTYDPNLKPEFTTEVELGAELQFFKNRIGVDFTWYDRRTIDQIAPVSLPRSTGAASYYTNFGEMSNKGVEIGLTLVPVELQNSFTWKIYGTFTKNVSEVISLVDGIERITLNTGSTSEPQPTLQPGYPYGFLRGSVIARDDEGNPLVNPASGAYLEAPELGDLGNPYPDFKASVANTFSYKGVSLGFLFDFRVGGILVSGPASDMLGRGVTKDTEDRMGTRILPGVLADPNTLKPLLDASGNKIPNTVQITENSLWFAESDAPTFAINGVDEFTAFDATVFRLSEISLGWDLPDKWLSKTFIGAANFSVVARNLWYYAPGFPKYTRYDPGSNAFGSGNVQGIDRESAPTIRRVGFNLKLTF
ncbi:MAG: SusC/RagA family TonB-linked outer membrane protein [Prevotellaceae bacterium]|nr:SusC/RagA family TonB-linked outer membrane protein [Prevotellaceae bacterium]